MTYSDVIIGHVVTSSVKLRQEAPIILDEFDTFMKSETELNVNDIKW